MNYKLIFAIEIIAFIFLSFMAAAVEGPSGGLFGRKTVYGISGDMWLFVFAIPSFLLIPLVVKGFESKLFGVLLCGLFVGGILQDFFWFVVNPNFGVGNFNSSSATWLAWLKAGSFEIPYFYVICAFLAAVSWFVFIRNSKMIDRYFQRIRSK